MRPCILTGLLLASCGSSPSGDRGAEDACREAETAYRSGNYDRAVDRATAAIATAPDSPRPYLLRAKALDGQGKQEDAENDFTRALEKAPASSKLVYHFWRGLFHADRGRPRKALEDFDRACELQMRYPSPDYYLECYRERAKTYLALERIEEAVKDCDFILSKNPDETTRGEFEALRIQALRKAGRNPR